MVEFIYSTVPSKIKLFFDKIREVGKPEKATKKWLDSIGFTASNDPSLLTVIKFLGFIDSSGIPTDLWKKYRSGNYKIVLAQVIRQGYSKLFTTYPNANERSNKELNEFFRSESDAGDQVIRKTRLTFQFLCELADFKSFSENTLIKDTLQESEEKNTSKAKDNNKFSKRPIININIQLTLPETKDVDIYDKLFTSMKKHLFPGDIN